jgi:predicted nucleic acid-binding protein
VIYFDTAYIAKCYLDEPGSSHVQALAESADGLCSCEIARVELFSTMHRHLREGRLEPGQLREVLGLFRSEERDGVWTWLPITSDLVRATCDAVARLDAGVFIRSTDALHLRCARQHGHDVLYTNDRHVLAAAEHFGMTATNVIP